VLPEIIGTPLDKGAEIDALAKLPVEKQRSLAEAANAPNISRIAQLPPGGHRSAIFTARNGGRVLSCPRPQKSAPD
jgi:hypothetical protein